MKIVVQNEYERILNSFVCIRLCSTYNKNWMKRNKEENKKVPKL